MYPLKRAYNQYIQMRVDELIRVLKSFPPDLEVIASSDEEIWQVNPGSMRVTTLYSVDGDEIVEASEYVKAEDGEILDKHEALLIDLEI